MATLYRVVRKDDGVVLADGFEFAAIASLWAIRNRQDADETIVKPYCDDEEGDEE